MKSSAKVVYKPFIMRIRHRTFVDIISSLFILLFVYTGVNKLLDIDTLQLTLKSYPLLSGMVAVVAWGLPIAELLIAALLFIPATKLIGLYSSSVMMTGFTLYLIYMLIFTPELPCTCGGMLQQLTWPEHLIFNIVFVGLALLGIRSYKLDHRQKTKKEKEQALMVFT